MHDNPVPPGTLNSLRTTLKNDSTALGERLLVIGSGPIAVQGALGGVLTLDERGTAVLVAAFASVPPGAATALSDELDRLGQATGKRLCEVVTEVPAEELASVHRSTFDGSAGRRPSLNAAQRAIVVLTNKPGLETWRDLRTELGPRLSGIHLIDNAGQIVKEPVPDQLRKEVRSRSFKRWIAATAVIALLTGLLTGTFFGTRKDPAAGPGPFISSASVVAAPVPADATHNQWIGQRHVVRTSEGQLIAAFAGPDGLVVITDDANQGRSWNAPQTVAGVFPNSFGMAIDSTNRLHVAFQGREGIGYINLKESLTGLEISPVVRVDSTSNSPVVDIAFDSARSVAHIVFVKQAPDDSPTTPKQQPAWAAVTAPAEGDPSIIGSQTLAQPGDAISVLANIGVGPGSSVIATYRRGDSVNGWFARYLNAANPTDLAWSAEQPLPVADALYGAGSLAVDTRGNAHVVLRDNTTYGLTYLKRSPDGTWSPAEISVDAEVTEQIDYPSISADTTSDSVFIFFLDTTSVKQGEIKAVTRDPQSGWGAPSVAVSGGSLPSSIELAAGVSILLSTNSATGSLTASRVGVS